LDVAVIGIAPLLVISSGRIKSARVADDALSGHRQVAGILKPFPHVTPGRIGRP
jgi:hypothetical protein